ncbi:ATP-dependent RNA helicase DDX25 [Pteropus alecto]|uniref:ATP-dependent RNA helicase DDX25 n=1 Tax=Pteropus alecto TaxID=9402 RepID=L5KDY4_PTEAL|nr:ATP-dependent RNA helicase DDX25 [Pteropus alecto]
MLLLSATFEDSVWKFAERIIPDPNVIKLRKEELTLNNVLQYYVLCGNRKDKYQGLCNIYGGITIGQAITFCQTRRNAKWLTVEMMQDGHQVSLLSGELTVDQRASIIQRFRDGKEKVLITTNVCAQGVWVDGKHVTIIGNFDLPVNQSEEPDYETYLHGIGSTLLAELAACLLIAPDLKGRQFLSEDSELILPSWKMMGYGDGYRGVKIWDNLGTIRDGKFGMINSYMQIKDICAAEFMRVGCPLNQVMLRREA